MPLKDNTPLVSELVPTNILEEKAAFFADQKHNPQFVYTEHFNVEQLSKYGKPKPEYIELAKHIVKKAYHKRNEQDLQSLLGPVQSQAEVEESVTRFLHAHGLHDRYELIFSASYLSRTAITPNEIRFRMPVTYREKDLIGMIYHEIGTHALRRVNYERQPWYRKKKKYGFSEYLLTEEGLASLNALIPRSMTLAYLPALRYLAASVALEGSFVDVWNFLAPYFDSPDRRWGVTYRQKRGISDTSKPGAFTKDLVYFEGMVETWHWLQKNYYNPTNLYFGKLAAKDIDKAIDMNPHYKPLLPIFYTANPEKYAQKIEAIGLENELKTLSL